jgi:hypothetical protein
MKDLITRLREKREAHGIELDPQEAFDLMALACSACCTQIDGGNKTCPPKPAAE